MRVNKCSERTNVASDRVAHLKRSCPLLETDLFLVAAVAFEEHRVHSKDAEVVALLEAIMTLLSQPHGIMQDKIGAYLLLVLFFSKIDLSGLKDGEHLKALNF